MAEPDPIYQTPAAQPETPLFEEDDGYPIPDGITAEPLYYAAPDGFPDKRETRRFTGRVSYQSGGVYLTPAQLDGGRFNDVRRQLYRAYQRFWRYLFLHIGVVDFEASPTYAADWDVEEAATALLGKAWEFDAENVTGVGNENKILISWTSASDNDARALARASDGMPVTSISVGDMVIDERAGAYGQAQILDITYNGETSGTHTATLTLNKPLNAAREDVVWICRQNLLYTFPAISLKFEAAVCKNAIRSSHATFSSFASAYPSAYVSDGISGAWHCAAMNNASADLANFAAFCANTDCTVYEAHEEYLPAAYDISELWLARGFYLKMVSLTADPLGQSANFRKGLENFPGVLQLGGVLVGYNTYANQLLSKDTLYGGVAKYKTGETDANGYTEFLDFADLQAQRVTASIDESDSGTFLENMTGLPDKYDPAGGASSASRLLIDDADRTPGNTFSHAMGVRRVMARLPGQGEMDPGLSYGDVGSIAGLGTTQVQRVRHVRRASYPFTLGAVNSIRGSKTVLDVYATTQTTPGAEWDYDIKFVTPRFSNYAAIPKSPIVKAGISGNAANISFDSNFMTVEFAMKEFDLSRPNSTPGDPDIVNTVKIGGGFVASDIAHVITNPGIGDGVQYFGDPERLIYPGDVIAFDAEAVRDVWLTCVSAKAFSGSTDAAAVAPNAAAPGVPEFVRDNYNKRDVAVFALTPENGAIIEAYVTGVGASEQNIPIDYVAHGAVAPPLIDAAAASTGYAPTLKKTLKSTGVTSTVSTSEYLWEPNTGTFYIDSSTWDTGDYVLFAEMWVFDTRKLYPCSVSSAYEAIIDGLCECYYETALSLTSGDYEIKIDDDSPYTNASPLLFYSVYWDGPPYTAFDLDDGLIFQSEALGDNITATYLAPATLANYVIGCNPGAGSPDYTFQAPAFAFSSLGNLGRWRADDISEALIEISLEAPVITEAWIDRTLDENDYPVIDSGSSTTATSIDLTISLLSKTSGTDYDLQSTGLSVSSPCTKITISGTEYLRGTVDITNILKYVIENITTDGIEFLLMLGAGSMPAGTIDASILATGWIEYFFSNKSGDGTAPYTAGIRTWKVSCDDFTLGNVYIKTDAAKLEDGPELPRTAAGLLTDNPDLGYDPT